MGSQKNIGPGKISVHEPAEHIFTQHACIFVYKHAYFKRFFREFIISFLVLVGGIVYKFEVVCKGNTLVNTFERIKKDLKP